MSYIFIAVLLAIYLYTEHRYMLLLKKVNGMRDNIKKKSDKIYVLSNELNFLKNKKQAQNKAKQWKKRLITERGSYCQYCYGTKKSEELSIDHYIPLSRNGTNHHNNLRLCCIPCNTEKADMKPSTWEKKLRKRSKGFFIDTDKAM